MVVQRNKNSLTAAQLAAIEAGNFLAGTAKQKKAIQALLLADPARITRAVPAAIDAGKPLIMLKVPLEAKEDALIENRSTLRRAYIEGKRQWVLRFVATREESIGYLKDQNRVDYVTEEEMEQDIVSSSDEDNEDLIVYRGHSKDDPTGDLAVFNADKDRFLSQLPEYLLETYEMREAGFEQWEIAENLGIDQGTVSKRLSKVKQRWRKYYRA